MNKGEKLVLAVRSALENLTTANEDERNRIILVDDDSLQQHCYITKLDSSILSMHGMSGMMYRNFINSLMSSPDIESYLEVGCWTGSTAISALYKNNNVKTHWLIDNWSEWGNNGETEKQFHENWNAFIKDRSPVVINKDCFDVIPSEHGITGVDVYFCDGGNDGGDDRNVYRALTHFYESMSDQFVFIVDDWFSNTPNPNGDCGSRLRKQTHDAIKDMNLDLLFYVGMPQNNNTMSIDGRGNRFGWWNGCGILVLSKRGKIQ
jgi:hypothetical protein